MKLEELLTAVILLAMVGIIIGLSATVLTGVAETQCDYTWDTFEYSSGLNPIGGSYTGCCETINASNSSDCDTWSETLELNVTASALEGQETLADWQPTIAIIIAASVVIGILLTYLLARFM